MPPGRQSHGRQAHGRPLLSSKPAAKTFRKSKNKAQVKALDAFTTASELYAPKEKRTPRFREIEAAPEARKKRRAADDDDDEDGEDDEDEDDDQPRRKKAKPSSGGAGGDSDEYQSDSDGNEWHYGVNEDEDSELDSDEAFGDSDREDFQGYAFSGSKGKKKNQDDSEEEDDEDDDESLGEDAIDLAQALDEYESDESMADQDGQDDSDASDSEAESPPSSDEDEDDQEADPSKLGDLQKFIAGFGGGDDGDKDAAPTKQKQKISFKDLGLSGVKDAQMRKSVKLMAKEEKEATRPGAGKKLEVPLYKRQQDRLARAAAYEKASETIGRWQETVKQNRRADHLVFPLPQNAADEGLDNRELQAITATNSTGNELEQTILNIMQASGLAMNKQEENARAKAEREEGMSKEELQDMIHQRRRERELASRETKRAARIKKIKSKAYHRVHRKEKEREAAKLKEAMAENGDVEVDSEAERDAQDRARVLERVGARHRDSKWAKLGSSNKRAVWDDEYRAGLHDMARREEELRRRKEGRTGDSDGEEEEEDSDSEDGSEDEEGTGRRSGKENRRLLKQLESIDNEEDDGPKSDLMKMKFMQKAEAQQKKANDELIAQIRRDLDSGGSDDEEEDEVTQVGRKKYGSAAQPAISAPALSRKQKKAAAAAARGDDVDMEDGDDVDDSRVNTGYSLTAEPSTTGSAWSSGPRKKSAKTGGKSSGARVEDLDNSLAITASSSKPKSKSKASKSSAAAADTSSSEDSDSDSPDSHLPLAIRDISQMDKAFAGDDVVVDFAREKEAIQTADDDKIVDNTLPGWGGWVGDGVSAREKKRQQGRFLTKVEGVKKANRKDAKLERVIISEKRVKKNDKYLATQLPHQFESKEQYERSIRLPMGPEWVTKESHQAAVKPRVLKKQGIIAPMSRPTM
ncbi:small nucleolar ribonucleoprotein complex subunit utp14 [Colletotrichum scovillei]|uniref:Small nucleolar ribonucleoprotein complex subunit utp14 n=1 Tax=Colletotrichum scovillei TaxID=1209932 RepID=A0A9P7R4L6_9PEZI|nr:small nucleolar ribonucleoprotein complex subunit utp14 [Colletotrichum scovillei]KAG7067289.1 small nucleolar ribonucleoprotein complex subunit utp14 [Colletotrichum scovillei]